MPQPTSLDFVRRPREMCKGVTFCKDCRSIGRCERAIDHPKDSVGHARRRCLTCYKEDQRQ